MIWDIWRGVDRFEGFCGLRLSCEGVLWVFGGFFLFGFFCFSFSLISLGFRVCRVCSRLGVCVRVDERIGRM